MNEVEIRLKCLEIAAMKAGRDIWDVRKAAETYFEWATQNRRQVDLIQRPLVP